ncbi:c-type cytochrome [Deminuibacter soli]|nr:cytochrome c [Deminuibacter soli]
MKRVLVTAGVAACALAWLVTGCAKTNETELKNEGNGGDTTIVTCDTVNSKYSTAVQPILQANCYSCHANGNVNGGVTLGSYANVKQQATNGNLIGVITHASGYPAMPEGAPKLSDCDINKIRSWIANGAQDN